MKKLLLYAAMMFSAYLSQAQWQPDQRLTNNPANSYTSYNNAKNIAISGDTVHVVWQDNRDGNDEIYYKRSIDGGLTWEQIYDSLMTLMIHGNLPLLFLVPFYMLYGQTTVFGE